MWTRKELKTNAKNVLKNNYWPAVGIMLFVVMIISIVTTLIMSVLFLKGFISIITSGVLDRYDLEATLSREEVLALIREIISYVFTPSFFIVFVITAIVYVLFLMLVVNPLVVGMCKWGIENRKDKASFSELWTVFKNNYSQTVVTMFVYQLIVFLWTLLLIVPGIIKTYQYMMVPYLIADNPELTRKEACEQSREMMKGQKWNAFVLGLSFLGWILLAAALEFIPYIPFSFVLTYFFVTPYMFLTEIELYAKLKGYGEPLSDQNVEDAYYEEVSVDDNSSEL